MNGELAQAICLASHGSVWLADAAGEPPDLAQSDSTFQFVGALSFRGPKRRWRPEEQTTDPRDWLRGRRAAGIDRIWLELPGRRSPQAHERQLAAFANGSPWGLLGSGSARAELWQATWTVGDRKAADQRIWTVEYHGRHVTEMTPPQPDIAAADEHLRRLLREAADFAQAQGLQHWAELFQDAAGVTDEIPQHPIMLPEEYPLEARRLAAAAGRGWVFGGMGSWNDLYFDDADVHQTYDDLSSQLYAAVLTGLVASVNSSL